MRLLISAIIAGAAIVGLVALLLYDRRNSTMPASAFGQYRSFPDAGYDGTKRVSAYLTLGDGTRLAYDLILPTRKGVPASERLAALFKYTPYLRTWTIFDERGNNLIADFIELSWQDKAFLKLRYWFSNEGERFDPLSRTKWLEAMVKHGYAVIIVERPGTGASFGVMNPIFEASAREVNEVLDWIAAQPWSDGNIGMFGDSFQAMVQFAAAAIGNPHLKAIFPASSPIELYDSVEYPGGVYNKAFATFFAGAAAHLERLVTPVDGDKDRTLLALALAERRRATMGERLDLSSQRYAFRDSLTPDGKQPWRVMALYPFIDRINRAGVPIYMTTGWYDIFVSDQFLWWTNLTVPRRLTVRPLDHAGMDKSDFDLDYSAEAGRWFDHWLKGVETGISEEARIHYYVMGAPQESAWQASQDWPPSGLTRIPHYFAQGRSGTVSSVNDGSLSLAAPPDPAGFDSYTIDYTTTSGTRSRWTAVNFPHDYPDRRNDDAKALTYTGPRLAEARELTGHPIAHIWLATEAPDLDVFIYVEDVTPDGMSRYVTEGTLRESHRKTGDAPFKTPGLPWHSHFESDLMPIPPKKPIELVFALLPTRTGLPWAIASESPLLSPTPTISKHRSLRPLPPLTC
jgi:putative CocE/NonD family hydrolase